MKKNNYDYNNKYQRTSSNDPSKSGIFERTRSKSPCDFKRNYNNGEFMNRKFGEKNYKDNQSNKFQYKNKENNSNFGYFDKKNYNKESRYNYNDNRSNRSKSQTPSRSCDYNNKNNNFSRNNYNNNNNYYNNNQRNNFKNNEGSNNYKVWNNNKNYSRSKSPTPEFPSYSSYSKDEKNSRIIFISFDEYISKEGKKNFKEIKFDRIVLMKWAQQEILKLKSSNNHNPKKFYKYYKKEIKEICSKIFLIESEIELLFKYLNKYYNMSLENFKIIEEDSAKNYAEYVSNQIQILSDKEDSNCLIPNIKKENLYEYESEKKVLDNKEENNDDDLRFNLLNDYDIDDDDILPSKIPNFENDDNENRTAPVNFKMNKNKKADKMTFNDKDLFNDKKKNYNYKDKLRSSSVTANDFFQNNFENNGNGNLTEKWDCNNNNEVKLMNKKRKRNAD